MIRTTLLSAALLLAAGCATAEKATPSEPLRFAVIAAPSIGGPPVEIEGEEWRPEDLLLEAVTQLSLEPGIDVVLVPGPLLDPGLADDPEVREEAIAALVGALGSLAAPVAVALGPEDGPRVELLEALERGVPDHPGKGAYSLGRIKAWSVATVDPEEGHDVAAAEAAAPPHRILRPHPAGMPLHGHHPSVDVPFVEVVAVPRDRFGRSKEFGGDVHVSVPPLIHAPHAVAFGRIEGGQLFLELRGVVGGEPPPPLEPVSVLKTN